MHEHINSNEPATSLQQQSKTRTTLSLVVDSFMTDVTGFLARANLQLARYTFCGRSLAMVTALLCCVLVFVVRCSKCSMTTRKHVSSSWPSGSRTSCRPSRMLCCAEPHSIASHRCQPLHPAVFPSMPILSSVVLLIIVCTWFASRRYDIYLLRCCWSRRFLWWRCRLEDWLISSARVYVEARPWKIKWFTSNTFARWQHKQCWGIRQTETSVTRKWHPSALY